VSKTVSYSQYAVYKQCNYRWYLEYAKGLKVFKPSIHLIFGTAAHETLQNYLQVMFDKSATEADKIHLPTYFKTRLMELYKQNAGQGHFSTPEELSEFYEVPCATENGETVWRRIEAVTQHPVINEDGTNTMLKVITKGNREVTATKAKSFLQLIDGKIQQVHGKDLKVGDYLPCSRKELEYKENHLLNLREILSPKEYIYGSELEKARKVVGEFQWWKKHS